MKDADDRPAGIRLRAALPSDIDAVQRFIAALSLRSRVQRFFAPLRELPAGMASALQCNDPAHRFIVAERSGEVVGLGQYAVDASGERCEVALVIDDRVQGLGLGRHLLGRLLADAARAGLGQAMLETLAGNEAMRALARRCGFELVRHPEDPLMVLGRRPLAGA